MTLNLNNFPKYVMWLFQSQVIVPQLMIGKLGEAGQHFWSKLKLTQEQIQSSWYSIQLIMDYTANPKFNFQLIPTPTPLPPPGHIFHQGSHIHDHLLYDYALLFLGSILRLSDHWLSSIFWDITVDLNKLLLVCMHLWICVAILRNMNFVSHKILKYIVLEISKC